MRSKCQPTTVFNVLGNCYGALFRGLDPEEEDDDDEDDGDVIVNEMFMPFFAE